MFGIGAQLGSSYSQAAALTDAGTFGARMARNNSTTLSLARFGNAALVVNGIVSQVSATRLCSNTENVLDSDGLDGGITPQPSTLYYAYVSNGAAQYEPDAFKLSATAPSLVSGVYYLGTSGNPLNWRFLGWVYTDGSSNFTDSETARHVVNYYNRRPLRLFTCPAYNDNNAQTTYGVNLAAFARINGGTGDTVSWISNGEDAAWLHAHALFSAVGASAAYIGPGFDSTTLPECVSGTNAAVQAASAGAAKTLAAGLRSGYLLACTQGTAYTAVADTARLGAASDPPATFLSGWCLG